MATINGIIHSYKASARRTEREQQRKAQEMARLFKEQQKQQDFDDAAQAAHNWATYTEMLKSVHKEANEPIDWEEISNTAKPVEPEYSDFGEATAQELLDNFKPSILGRIFGKVDGKVKILEDLVAEARAKDKKQHRIALNLDRIDPSDSMRNFLHNMKFKKMSGFEAVERVVYENN